MTRDYGRVKTQFWESETLIGVSVPAKFLALYLLTSPHTNAIGCFRLPAAYIGHDTGLAPEELERAFTELRAAKFVVMCERLPWVYLPKHLKHNPPENPNVWRKCVKELEGLPGEITAREAIAAQLYGIAFEPRMANEASKSRVSEEERTRLKRFEYGCDTVEDGQIPIPCPNLDLSDPNHTQPANAGGVVAAKVIPEDFETFWTAYQGPKNSKKPEAIKAWAAMAKVRPSLPDLLRAAANYARWLAEESRKQKRDHPKQHHSTWLLNEMWNNYGDDGTELTAEQIAINKDRADRVMRRGKYAEQMQ